MFRIRNFNDLKFAFKCSAVNVNGEWRDVYKQPQTDPSKNSKRGRFHVIGTKNAYATVPVRDGLLQIGDQLQTVFEDGFMKKTEPFSAVKDRASL